MLQSSLRVGLRNPHQEHPGAEQLYDAPSLVRHPVPDWTARYEIKLTLQQAD